MPPCENEIAQELAAHSYKLRFYRKKGVGELDFVIEKGDGRVLPIEVKSGKSYKRHNALTKVLESPNYDIPSAVVLCEGNAQRHGKVDYLPVYMVMFV